MNKRRSSMAIPCDPKMQDPTPYAQSFAAKPNVDGVLHKVMQSYVLDDAERRVFKKHITRTRSMKGGR